MLSSSLVPFWGNFCDILKISPRLPTMCNSKEGKFCSLWFVLLFFKFALQWSEYLLWNNTITYWGYSILCSMSYCIALCYITSYYIVLQSVGMWTSCSLILLGHAVLQSASLPALAPGIGYKKAFARPAGSPREAVLEHAQLPALLGGPGWKSSQQLPPPVQLMGAEQLTPRLYGSVAKRGLQASGIPAVFWSHAGEQQTAVLEMVWICISMRHWVFNRSCLRCDRWIDKLY